MQSWIKYLINSKEINPYWAAFVNFDNWFCVTFDRYWQRFISGKKTGHNVSTQYWDFHDFLKFPKRQLIQINLYRVYFGRFQFLFDSSRIKLELKLCEALKYFDQDKSLFSSVIMIIMIRCSIPRSIYMKVFFHDWTETVICEICRIFLFFLPSYLKQFEWLLSRIFSSKFFCNQNRNAVFCFTWYWLKLVFVRYYSFSIRYCCCYYYCCYYSPNNNKLTKKTRSSYQLQVICQYRLEYSYILF